VKYSKPIWDQLKALSSGDLIRVLTKDGWEQVDHEGAEHIFRHPEGRLVSMHHHPASKKGYGAKLLKNLLAQIGWSEEDMRRLKLIK